MIKLTETQQEQIKKERKYKERREMLLAARSKIKDGIERNNNRSGERAIWELMQNARDLSKHAIAKVTLSPDSITFAHKGEPFNLDTLSNLIKQQSTKKDDDDSTVGQYGTGFMATYIFSRKVYISGDCRIECGDSHMYVPLPNNFCLDRSSDNREDFVSEMDYELNMVESLIGEPGNATPGEWTSFRYPLSSDKVEKISKQIETTSKLMPYVLAFNDRIEECLIDNLGDCILFRKECRNAIPMDHENYNKVETKIHVKNGNSEDVISVFSLESIDGKDRIIIPPLPIGFDDTSVIPSQFIFFPMLGTENWGTNFIFHSSRLFPVEERNSFFFPKDDDNVKTKYTHNEQVLGEMIDMLFAYYRNNSEEQHLPIDFAKVDFDYNGDDEVTKSFYESLQKRFAEEFVEWEMIPTDKGYKSIKGDSECCVLDEDIYKHVDEEKMKDYISAIVKYIPSNLTVPNKDDIIEWSKIVKKWSPTTVEYYLTMEDICHNVEAEDEELYTLLQFLKDLGTKGAELLEKCALIPNREGKLMKLGDLRNGENITDVLYEIAKPILGEAKDKLINTKYAGLFASSLSAYTRNDLRNEIKSVIDDYQNHSLKHKTNYNNSDPVLLEENAILDLIKYCMAFDTASPTDYRARLLETICDLHDITFNPIFIPQIEEDKPDLYSTSFNFLVEHTMFRLSQKSTEWLSNGNNRGVLYQFVEKCLDTKDEDKLDNLRNWLNKYGIIPNQLDELCKLDDLKVNKNIDEDLQELYKKVFDVDLKASFVAPEFAALLQLSEYNPKDVGAKIEEHFEEELKDSRLQSKEILVILNHLDSGWEDYFKNIAPRREELYYKFGSDDDRSALFQIQMQGSDKLQRMAELIKSEYFDDILARAERLAEQAQERERQFMFAYTIGKLLENSIREKIGAELSCIYENGNDVLSAEDVQCGQDIVIRYKDKPLYYIECKAKWNFTEPAHMSSLQMRQAVEKAGRYALFCIDCTSTTGCGISPNATEDEVLKSRADILEHTYVHQNLNEAFGDILKPIISHEKEPFAEDKIRVNGDFSCDIPKKVFISGQHFNSFMASLIEYLRGKISNIQD